MSDEVGELLECVVICFEVGAFPEPKILNHDEFKELSEVYGSQGKSAKAVGVPGPLSLGRFIELGPVIDSSITGTWIDKRKNSVRIVTINQLQNIQHGPYLFE